MRTASQKPQTASKTLQQDLLPGAGRDLEAPRRILGRYRVVPGGFLGEGSWCVVWRGEDEKSGRHVAIKTFRPDAVHEVADSLLESRFAREIGTFRQLGLCEGHDATTTTSAYAGGASSMPLGPAKKLDPKHFFVKVLDFSRRLDSTASADGVARPGAAPDGCYYIVLELGDETLESFMRRRPYGSREIREVTRVVAEGLSELHARGICHLDIKPANIMLFGSEWKIIDLEGSLYESNETIMPVTDLVISGSKLHCSPEFASAMLEAAGERTLMGSQSIKSKRSVKSHSRSKELSTGSSGDGYNTVKLRLRPTRKMDIWSAGVLLLDLLAHKHALEECCMKLPHGDRDGDADGLEPWYRWLSSSKPIDVDKHVLEPKASLDMLRSPDLQGLLSALLAKRAADRISTEDFKLHSWLAEARRDALVRIGAATMSETMEGSASLKPRRSRTSPDALAPSGEPPPLLREEDEGEEEKQTESRSASRSPALVHLALSQGVQVEDLEKQDQQSAPLQDHPSVPAAEAESAAKPVQDVAYPAPPPPPEQERCASSIVAVEPPAPESLPLPAVYSERLQATAGSDAWIATAPPDDVVASQTLQTVVGSEKQLASAPPAVSAAPESLQATACSEKHVTTAAPQPDGSAAAGSLQPKSLLIPDPRKPDSEVEVLAFSPLGRSEPCDALSKVAFLSMAYDMGTSSPLELQVPKFPGVHHRFLNAEAAYQALRCWGRAAELEPLAAKAAVEVAQQFQEEDSTFAGFGSRWTGMLAVLCEKFSPASALAAALVQTGDAFLLCYLGQPHQSQSGVNAVVMDPLYWSDNGDGSGRNSLGLLLMLIRDTLSECNGVPRRNGSMSWTDFLRGCGLDAQTGEVSLQHGTMSWQKSVQDAHQAIRQQLERGEASMQGGAVAGSTAAIVSSLAQRFRVGRLDGPPGSVASPRPNDDAARRVASAFALYDPEGGGTVERRPFFTVLQQVEPTLSEPLSEHLLAVSGAERDVDRVDYQFFLQWLFGPDCGATLQRVATEGAKIGTELRGASRFSQLDFVAMRVNEPAGDMGLVLESLHAMNMEVPPGMPSSDAPGGSSHVGKMIFSMGMDRLAVVSYVPEERQKDLRCAEWLKAVLDACGGEAVWSGNSIASGRVNVPSPRGGQQVVERSIAAANAYLCNKGLVQAGQEDAAREHQEDAPRERQEDAPRERQEDATHERQEGGPRERQEDGPRELQEDAGPMPEP